MKPLQTYEERRLKYLLRWSRFEMAYQEFGLTAVPPRFRKLIDPQKNDDVLSPSRSGECGPEER